MVNHDKLNELINSLSESEASVLWAVTTKLGETLLADNRRDIIELLKTTGDRDEQQIMETLSRLEKKSLITITETRIGAAGKLREALEISFSQFDDVPELRGLVNDEPMAFWLLWEIEFKGREAPGGAYSSILRALDGDKDRTDEALSSLVRKGIILSDHSISTSVKSAMQPALAE